MKPGASKIVPQKWADRFLEWYCRPELLEDIQGDAYELFYRRAKSSVFKARFYFIWNVIRFFRWRNIRKQKIKTNSRITIDMLINLLKVAIRNFFRQPSHSILNVVGLSTGLAATLFIMLWVQHELSYDKFHNNPQRIFKVMSQVDASGVINTYDASAAGIDVSSIPEIEHHVTVISGTRWPNELCFRPEGKADECIYLNGIYAGESFFDVFNFEIIQGDTKPLVKPTNMAISREMAKRLFNTSDVIGKTIKIDDFYEVTIASVFQDVSSTSSIRFDFVLPLTLFKRMRGFTDEKFNESFFSAYVKTNQDVDADALSVKLNAPLVLPEDLKNEKVQYMAHPFLNWHLKNKFENGKNIGGQIQYIILYVIVALLIILMAVINYVNMSTARASQRSKEIGIRKITGAYRSNIVWQFLGESFLVVLAAFMVSLIILKLLMPFFSSLVGETISFTIFSNDTWIYFLSLLIIITLAGGLYPAFVMSSFQPASVLKLSHTAPYQGAQKLRRVLVTVQLTASMAIIIFGGTLFHQLDYITNKNLGFDRTNMIRIEPTYRLLKKYDAFKNDLLSNDAITHISTGNANPLSNNGHLTGVEWPGKPEDLRITFQTMGGNYGYAEAFGLKLIEGKFFSPENSDSLYTDVLLSKESVSIMGLDNPIGQIIKLGDSPCKVVGVIEDFHTESLHNERLPVIIYRHAVLNSSAIYVKYESGATQQAIEGIKNAYKTHEPSFTLRYWFQDETFDNLYKTEITASYLILSLTIISLVIAMVGVVGLATFNVSKRKKEIGIKRVFGATVTNILTMLSKEFLSLTVISISIATPLTWFAIDQWLEGYAYRISVPWWLFIATFATLLSATVMIIWLQGFKAASTNPVQTLRND
jgi:putative ABC transport system permease protein